MFCSCACSHLSFYFHNLSPSLQVCSFPLLVSCVYYTESSSRSWSSRSSCCCCWLGFNHFLASLLLWTPEVGLAFCFFLFLFGFFVLNSGHHLFQLPLLASSCFNKHYFGRLWALHCIAKLQLRPHPQENKSQLLLWSSAWVFVFGFLVKVFGLLFVYLFVFELGFADQSRTCLGCGVYIHIDGFAGSSWGSVAAAARSQLSTLSVWSWVSVFFVAVVLFSFTAFVDVSKSKYWCCEILCDGTLLLLLLLLLLLQWLFFCR